MEATTSSTPDDVTSANPPVRSLREPLAGEGGGGGEEATPTASRRYAGHGEEGNGRRSLVAFGLPADG
jgi:hypothetical protein